MACTGSKTIPTTGTGSDTYSFGFRFGSVSILALQRAYNAACANLEAKNAAAAKTVCTGLCSAGCKCSIQIDNNGGPLMLSELLGAYILGSSGVPGAAGADHASTGIFGGRWTVMVAGSVSATCEDDG